MKKIFLFAACAAFAMTGCSDDDNNTNNSANYLIGDWAETAPTANAHKIKFSTAKIAIVTDTDGSKDTLDYKVQNGKLYFYPTGTTTGGSTHDLQKVSDTVIKLGNIYTHDDSNTTPPVITTFTKK